MGVICLSQVGILIQTIKLPYVVFNFVSRSNELFPSTLYNSFFGKLLSIGIKYKRVCDCESKADFNKTD